MRCNEKREAEADGSYNLLVIELLLVTHIYLLHPFIQVNNNLDDSTTLLLEKIKKRKEGDIMFQGKKVVYFIIIVYVVYKIVMSAQGTADKNSL